MDVYHFIQSKLSESLNPMHLCIEDESHLHNVPDGAQSHFKVTVVSDNFKGQRLLQRHRSINNLLSEALAGPVHALALHTFTSDEWNKRTREVNASPTCLGGSKLHR